MDTRCNVLQLLGHWDLHPKQIWGFFGANDLKDFLRENTKSCKRALGLLCFLCSRFVCTIDLPFCTVNIENLQHIRGWNWKHPTYFFLKIVALLLTTSLVGLWVSTNIETPAPDPRRNGGKRDSSPTWEGIGAVMLCNSISLVDCLLSTFIFHSWPKHAYDWAHLDLIPRPTKHLTWGRDRRGYRRGVAMLWNLTPPSLTCFMGLFIWPLGLHIKTIGF